MVDETFYHKLLALDVGFSNTGYTVWNNGAPVAAGLLTTAKSDKKTTRVADDYSWRSAHLAGQLKDVCRLHNIAGIVGELPSGGTKSARAAVQMGMANAAVSASAELLKIPVEWCTPAAVKKAMTGKKNASKQEMMDTAIWRYGGVVDVKQVKAPKTKTGFQDRTTYTFLGKKWPGGKFEHIADSIGAYRALAGGNLVRMYG